MYIPGPFRITDLQQLTSFIQTYSFGTLFSQTDGEPFATHLPFLMERDEHGEYVLLAHMAKSNPHWEHIRGKILVVFLGPHAYISPTWYQEPDTVPTWNYVTVHVYGEFIPVTDQAELFRIIQKTIDQYESTMPTPWATDLHNAQNEQLMKMIVGFKIKITKFEGKWKLSQNHSVERRTRLIDGLRHTDDRDFHAIADLMEATIKML